MVDTCVQEKAYINILTREDRTLIIRNGDDLYMIFCCPDRELEELVSRLAAAEGLFFRRA